MKQSKGIIEPLAVYSVDETSELLDVDRKTTYNLVRSGELTARKVGKGYKILGENVLSYLGSITYQPKNENNPQVGLGAATTENG